MIRFAAWQLMWAAAGVTIGAPLILLSRLLFTMPDLAYVTLGSCTVFAGWGIGTLVHERWSWPHWLDS